MIEELWLYLRYDANPGAFVAACRVLTSFTQYPKHVGQTFSSLSLMALRIYNQIGRHSATLCSTKVTIARASFRQAELARLSVNKTSKHFSSCTQRLKQQDNHAAVGTSGPGEAEQLSDAKKKSANRKAARSQSKTSLRQVAVEAQLSQDGFIKGRGKRRFVDPDASTKDVTASCAAEKYNI